MTEPLSIADGHHIGIDPTQYGGHRLIGGAARCPHRLQVPGDHPQCLIGKCQGGKQGQQQGAAGGEDGRQGVRGGVRGGMGVVRGVAGVGVQTPSRMGWVW